ncbi:MAG: cell division protein ZapA [Thermotaleaceae bacterium]
MSTRNKVIVRIYGQEYTMVSIETREYMQKVANYVDDKMEEIAKKSGKLSTAMVAVLTALNVADDYFKTKEELEGLENVYLKTKEQLESLENEAMRPLKELQEVREQLAVAKELMDEKGMEYRETVEEKEIEMKLMTDKYEEREKENQQERENFLQQIKILEEKLLGRENEIEILLKDKEAMENKLFDSQKKYVQARKELDAFIDTFDEEKKK